jgi:tetratricopeptide (TPR) repeat protein
VLPNKLRGGKLQPEKVITGLKDLVRDLVDRHAQERKALREALPRVAPEFESMLPPGEGRRLLRNQLRHKQNGPLIQQITDVGKENLPGVFELVSAGKVGDALNLLNERFPQYQEVILTAMVFSEDEDSANDERWDGLLKRFGMPIHYAILGYSAWARGDFDRAIDLTERALHASSSGKQIPSFLNLPVRDLKNNLAYYYADKVDAEKREQAFQYARESVDDGAEDYAALDSLGFVTITFALTAEEVLEGLTMCEDARRQGAEIVLYFKHVLLAEARLAELMTR